MTTNDLYATKPVECPDCRSRAIVGGSGVRCSRCGFEVPLGFRGGYRAAVVRWNDVCIEYYYKKLLGPAQDAKVH